MSRLTDMAHNFLLGYRTNLMISAHYGPGGSLSVDKLPPELDGLLHELSPEAAEFYGGRYLIAESMSIHTARAIAKALGLNIEEMK